VFDVGSKLLTAGLRSFDDDLEQEGRHTLAVVVVLQADSGSQGTQGRQAGYEAREFAVQWRVRDYLTNDRR
jgi:hypothetical protein